MKSILSKSEGEHHTENRNRIRELPRKRLIALPSGGNDYGKGNFWKSYGGFLPRDQNRTGFVSFIAISRLQVGRCFGSWVSTKISLCMRGRLHQDLDRPHPHPKFAENLRPPRSRADWH